ncbi:MAG TPA: acyltransferase domain-containing protein [Conexibacter sp.]|nr:acyltransferase domain-containing protein [Conexibacter sp.]
MEAGAPTIFAHGEESAAAMRRRLAAMRARLSDRPDLDALGADAGRVTDVDDAAPVKAAFVAANAGEALRAVDAIDRWLALDAGPALRIGRGTVLASLQARPRVGLLLPGQGVPAPRQLGAIASCFPDVAAAHTRADIPHGSEEDDGIPPAAIQHAIVAASLAAVDVVHRLHVTPAFALGHSLGELTALSWADAFDDGVALRLARARGDAMVMRTPVPGGMVAVDADPTSTAELLEGLPLTIACFNAPERQAVAGPLEALDALLVRARERGVPARQLAVTGAFHSPLMSGAATTFDAALRHLHARPLRGQVISSVTGTWLAADVDLRTHLRDQMLAPVRFLDAARIAARHADVLIETGPGRALAALMAEIDSDTPVVSLRVGERSRRRLLELIATTWACGLTPAGTVAERLRRFGDAQASASRNRRSSAATTSS